MLVFKRGRSLATRRFNGTYDGTLRSYRHSTLLGDTVMPLTDTRIRNVKPKAQAHKLSDGGGMYLLVTPKGARYWRLDYRFAGKRRTLALGIYPIVSLSNARCR